MTHSTLRSTFGAMVLGLLALGHTTASQASLYSYAVANPSGNHSAGQVTDLETSFHEGTRLLSWSHTILAPSPGHDSNGFWLVISDGANPKTHGGEYAILYGDADRNTITAYEYSGENNGASWRSPGHLLGSFDLQVSRDYANQQSTFRFEIDTSIISAYTGHCSETSGNCDQDGVQWHQSLWKGAAFTDQLGYWLHPVFGGKFGYSGEEITYFQFDQQGWYDEGQLQTTAVSEPTNFALVLCLIFMGIQLHRKRRHFLNGS